MRDVIFSVAGEETLHRLVTEFKASGDYDEQVYRTLSGSYNQHYRQIVPEILKVLTVRSNNRAYQPVIEALELIERYAKSRQISYPEQEIVPFRGVIRPGWQLMMLETDTQGRTRINRINYEMGVLMSLHDRLRSKEIWGEGADHFRNPETDLPQDFDTHREHYYAALGQPVRADVFIRRRKQTMH